MMHLLTMGLIGAGATIIILFIIIACLARELGQKEGRLGTYEEREAEAKTITIGERRG